MGNGGLERTILFLEVLRIHDRISRRVIRVDMLERSSAYGMPVLRSQVTHNGSAAPRMIDSETQSDVLSVSVSARVSSTDQLPFWLQAA